MKHISLIFVSILTLTLSFSAGAQVLSFSLRGKITDTSGKGVDGANVMLRKPGGKAMLGFTLSKADGSYSILVNTESDIIGRPDAPNTITVFSNPIAYHALRLMK